MPDLRFQQPDDDATLEDWRHVHNTIIPTHVLSLEEVRERSGRHHLEIAYLDDVLVGCSTVRLPTGDSMTATVIARVPAGHRGRGFGEALYVRGLDRARELGARSIETVVLSSNEDGLRFAKERGFVETERYLLPGDTIPWIDLHLPRSAWT
ncbi:MULTISPECIES: GNAT family N-acetyltransferase [unclassified Streptomyces]|uniref:GNAT family N-acetyltransferase n=1 Tax=unclassified Streptomyces TaxID=2593676 RepID=UPI0004BDBC87|nr:MULTISPECIES: GNAT family N-acetyltransferase [unclassified Streptomyces]